MDALHLLLLLLLYSPCVRIYYILLCARSPSAKYSFVNQSDRYYYYCYYYTHVQYRVCASPIINIFIYIYTHYTLAYLYTRTRRIVAHIRIYIYIICISRVHCFPIVVVHCTPALFLLRFIFLVFLVAICAVDGYILLCRYDVPYRYI